MSRVLSALTPTRSFVIALLLGAVAGVAVVAMVSCESTVKSPYTGQEVTREELGYERQLHEQKARADAATAAAQAQATKDNASRETRTELARLQRTATAAVEDLDAQHASKVREIRTTTENAVAEITAKLEGIHADADLRIASTSRELETELGRIGGVFAAASERLDRKDALRSTLTGGLLDVGNQVVPMAAAAAGPAGGVVTSIWSIVAGVLAGGGVAGTAGVLAKKKADAKADAEARARAEAEARAAETRAQASEAFNAIEVAKAAVPELAAAWVKAKPVIKEWSGENATKLVHDLKEFGKAA